MTTDTPLVSVILPTCKRPGTLGRAIDSVLRQTYANLELIVVDDNDRDGVFRQETERFMQKYAGHSNLIYLKHNQNRNGAAARNTGIRHSKAKYIAFLDDDDEFLPEKIAAQVDRLEKLDQSWGGVYCAYNYYLRGHLLQRRPEGRAGNLTKELLLQQVSPPTSTWLMRRSALVELGGFDETFIRHQDWEILVRFFSRYKLAYLGQSMAVLHLDNTSNRSDPDLLFREKQRYLEKYSDKIESLGTEVKDQIYKVHLLEAAKRYVLARKYAVGWDKVRQASSHAGLSFSDRIGLAIYFFDSILHFKEGAKKIVAAFRR